MTGKHTQDSNPADHNVETEAAAEDNKWKKFNEEQAAETEENHAEAAGELDYASRQQLEDQLTAKEQQLADMKDQLLRARAEVDNVQRRSEREISNAYKFSVNKLLGDLLPVVDSLIRGLEGSVNIDNPQVEAMRQGMQLTLDLLEKTMDKHGVKEINPEPGEPFNPELHEAMSAIPNPELPPNSVAQVLQKGYQLHERVLRAAMVMVTK